MGTRAEQARAEAQRNAHDTGEPRDMSGAIGVGGAEGRKPVKGLDGARAGGADLSNRADGSAAAGRKRGTNGMALGGGEETPLEKSEELADGQTTGMAADGDGSVRQTGQKHAAAVKVGTRAQGIKGRRTARQAIDLERENRVAPGTPGPQAKRANLMNASGKKKAAPPLAPAR
jgi:hypothetical protein